MRYLALVCVLLLSGCGSEPTPIGTVTAVSQASFGAEISRYKGYVLVDFWAEWCGPCKEMAPVVEQVAGVFDGKIKFAKLNVDQGADLAQKYKITSIPALVLFKDGKEIGRLIGTQPKDELKSWLETKTK